MTCVTRAPTSFYLEWREERISVKKRILDAVAEVASKMQDSGKMWGVVTVGSPWLLPGRLVPVRVYTAKSIKTDPYILSRTMLPDPSPEGFPSQLPVGLFVKEEAGSFIEHGAQIQYVHEGKSMELTLCHCDQRVFNTFTEQMKKMIVDSVYVSSLDPESANQLLGKNSQGFLKRSTG